MRFTIKITKRSLQKETQSENIDNTITAENFKYNKLTDILEVNGNVEFENETKDIKIFSQSAIYNKNNEEIVTKGNSKAINTDNTITAENFKYNKLTDILEVNGNVEFENETKDIKIFSQSAIYNKNNEEIVTRNSKAINIDNTITAENFKYNKNSNILNAKNKVTIFDNLNDVVIKLMISLIIRMKKVYSLRV